MRFSNWFLVVAVVAIVWVIFQGGEQRFATAERRPLNYDTVAVSDGLSPQAEALNLADNLDVSLLPDIGKQAIRDAAQQGLEKQAFLEHVLREVSNRVRDISTIDLNGDGNVDPILVRPEPAEQSDYVLLSLQVPAPDAYPLPAASDRAAWKKVDTIEVATMTVTLNKDALTVQATGNQYVYPGPQEHYTAYDRSPSFLQTYFAIRMLDWMFFPPMYGFWGPGWGYGFYRPIGVPTVMRRRADTVRSSGYSRAPASRQSAVRTSSGRAPRSAWQRTHSQGPPRSLRRLQASRSFSRRTGDRTIRRGGFGRSGQVQGSRGTTTSRALRRPSGGSSRRYSTFRSRSRGFGGFGRAFRGRGFGGFGRGFRFRR